MTFVAGELRDKRESFQKMLEERKNESQNSERHSEYPKVHFLNDINRIFSDINQMNDNEGTNNNQQFIEFDDHSINKNKRGILIKKIMRSFSNPPKKVQINKDQKKETENKKKNEKKKKKSTNITIPIENEPKCIAIGDIEGDINKLQHFCKFINLNQNLDFIFIGDFIDDVSDENDTGGDWECIFMICNEYLVNDNLIFKSDFEETNTKYNHKYSKKKVISLPSGFQNIQFSERNYDEIQNRVKFVAGNAEYDCLSDLIKGYKHTNDSLYVFGNGKYKKTLTFDKMRYLYLYLSNCNGVITLKNENQHQIINYKETIYFRHWIKKFNTDKYSFDILKQSTSITQDDIKKQNFIFICGHTRLFASGGPKEIANQEMFYFIDTSRYTDAKNKTPQQFKGLGSNDYRMALITIDEKKGFCVEAMSLPYKFVQSYFKYPLDQVI